jgi:hypothetical protein
LPEKIGGELESKGIAVIMVVAIAELLIWAFKVNICISYLIGTL